MELQELIEADGLKQGLLPHHFCGVTTNQHGQPCGYKQDF